MARADQDLRQAGFQAREFRSRIASRSDLPVDCLTSPAVLPMQPSETPHLKYNISAIEGGVLLSIWEPAPKNDIRVKPFLFMVRYRLPSELEARKLLSQYLAVYRVMPQTSPSVRGVELKVKDEG